MNRIIMFYAAQGKNYIGKNQSMMHFEAFYHSTAIDDYNVRTVWLKVCTEFHFSNQKICFDTCNLVTLCSIPFKLGTLFLLPIHFI